MAGEIGISYIFEGISRVQEMPIPSPHFAAGRTRDTGGNVVIKALAINRGGSGLSSAYELYSWIRSVQRELLARRTKNKSTSRKSDSIKQPLPLTGRSGSIRHVAVARRTAKTGAS